MAKKSDPEYVHLHNHSDYSRLDGMIKVDRLAQVAAEGRQRAVGLTDHGNPAGLIQLIKACKKYGITPVPGMEAYHVPDIAKARDLASEEGKSRFHLTLLAVSNVGYQNIMRLASISNTPDYYYYKPLIDDDLLAQYSEGIVATSSCLGSQFNQSLLADDKKEARRILGRHQDIFGKDNFYIEVQDHGIKDQKRITPAHLSLSKKMGIPLLATNDVHYEHQHDSHAHEAFLAMQTGATLSTPPEDRFTFSSDQNYMRTTKEMYRLFPESEFPNACSNTLVIAERAQDIKIALKSQDYLIPSFPGAEGREKDMLRDLVLRGAMVKYGDAGRFPEKVSKQIEFELDVIDRMGFNAYFLIVADIVQWAKGQDIAVGPGRGSAAGSIVSYLLDITTVDPLKYGLYFERFLNPGRRSMPDIDIDFEPSKRHLVRTYTANRFGADRVSFIGSNGELKSKGAIKASARVQGFPVIAATNLNKLAPAATGSGEISMRQIMGPLSEVPENLKASWDEEGARELRKIYARKTPKDPDDWTDRDKDTEIVKLAHDISGYYNQDGIHAAGVLITPGPLTDYVPLRAHTDKSEVIPVCTYDKDDVEDIGGLKMDFLGLINLSIIKEAVQRIREDLGIKVDIENIPLDDPKVYKLLSDGDTDGIFQLESDGMRKLLRRMQPDRFDDISATGALYRPGPMGSDMHNEYADRKNGRSHVELLHPDFGTLFEESFGLCIYQEQLIKLVQHFAGFTPAQADALRKATGKKDAAEIAAQEEKFKQGMLDKGYNKKLANDVWALIPPFASYSFNKSHSVAYGMITYQTAWLKVNYPAQYIAACIAYLDPSRVPAQVQSAKTRGISVSLPSVNKSDFGPRTSRDSIWLGLDGISHCGSATIVPMMAERAANGEFKSIVDFLVRMDKAGKRVNKKSLSFLIMAGCFDEIHGSRKAMLEQIEEITAAAFNEATFGDQDDEEGLFGEMASEGLAIDSFKFEGEDYSLSERIQMEMEALGFFAGLHPFVMVKKNLARLNREKAVPESALPVGSSEIGDGQVGTFYGTLADIERKVKKGRTIITYTLENDLGDSMKAIVFREINTSKAQVGALVVARGNVKTDSYSDEESLTIIVNTVEFVPLSQVVDEDAGNSYSIDVRDSKKKMQAAMAALAPYANDKKGRDKVTIQFKGEPVVLPVRLEIDSGKNKKAIKKALREHDLSLVAV